MIRFDTSAVRALPADQVKSRTLPLKVAAVVIASVIPALASAQSNVTLYGVADAAVGAGNRGDNTISNGQQVSTGTAFNVFSGVQSTSRFGIRGSEDLGDGLKAIFVAEAGWNVDDGTGSATGGGLNFARRSIVGLSGRFGTVALGRDYTPAYHAGIATDVFGYGLFGTAFTYQQSGGYTLRASNAVHYASPSLGGLVLRAVYGSGERDTVPRSLGNVYGVSAVYGTGPFTASAYYQQQRIATVPASLTTTADQQFGAGLGYNFGVVRVLGGFGRSKLDSANTNFDFWNLGAGVPLAGGEFLVGFTQLRADGGRNGLLGGTAGSDGRAKVYAVAYTYPLSKRTNLYASYGTTRNNDAGAFGVFASGTSVAAGAAGQSPKAVALGVRHQF